MFTFLDDITSVITWMFSTLSDAFPRVILKDITGKPHLLLTLFVLILVIYYSSATRNKIVDVTDIGYDDSSTNARQLHRRHLRLLKETNESRNVDELPPAYPNGWIPLLESRDISVGERKPVTAFGHSFVVFRGKTGKSFVLDAYCPHLGAHLGVDGKVHEDCIECPFHGWRFSGRDGSCVRIPYAQKVPEMAKVRSWEAMEQNGFIYVWHHAEGRPPLWKPPVIPEIENGLWSYKGRTVQVINCHMQEIAENVADTAHFNCLHAFGILSGILLHPDNWWKFIRNEWKTSWSPLSPSDSHRADCVISSVFKLFGIFRMPISLEIQQIGPAITHSYVKSSYGNGVFVHNTIPEGPLRQKFVRHYYSPSRFPNIFDRLLLFSESRMFERDVRIWNYKMYFKYPVYVSEDKTIAKFRRWYSQFYSENSPKVEKNNSLNW